MTTFVRTNIQAITSKFINSSDSSIIRYEYGGLPDWFFYRLHSNPRFGRVLFILCNPQKGAGWSQALLRICNCLNLHDLPGFDLLLLYGRLKSRSDSGLDNGGTGSRNGSVHTPHYHFSPGLAMRIWLLTVTTLRFQLLMDRETYGYYKQFPFVIQYAPLAQKMMIEK
jgi:hypothetical protein